MTTLRNALPAALAALLLSGCGLLDLLPAVPVGDALGLDGQRVVLTPDADLGTTAARNEFADRDLYANVPDLDLAWLPPGLVPRRLTQELGVADEVAVTFAAGAAAPERITVTSVALDLELADATTEPPVTEGYASGGAELVLARGACEGARCAYAVASGRDAATLRVVLDGAELERAYEILTDGGRNTVTGAYAVTVEPALEVLELELVLLADETVLEY